MARGGRDKKDVAIFTYSELHSPANDSYFYDQYRPDDSYVCASDVREVRPAWARTEDGSFLKIVNTDAFPQRIRMEVCRRAGEPCSFLPQGVTSSCRQRYSVHKMTAEYPDASSDETFLAAFKVPSGCFCHIRQKNTDQILSDFPGSIEGSEKKISPSLTFQKSLNDQNRPHRPPLLGPLNFDTPLNSQEHHPLAKDQSIQPTLLTSSFRQSTITTTLRPIITMTTSVFRDGASEELNTLSPSTTLSPPHFVTHHFHQPDAFQNLGPVTSQPELLREVRQNKDKISIYSQQLLDALLYNFNRAESLEGIPFSERDEAEAAFLKELQSLPEGLEITRAGNNTFNLSLRHVVKDGRVKPMNVIVSIENGLVKFIPNSDEGASSQYATATITVEELYEVLKKYLEVLQQRKPDDTELSTKEEAVSDLKASNVPTIHNHGSPIFIFASQTGRRLQTVDVSPPEIIELPLSLKPDSNNERHTVNLVRKSTNKPFSDVSTSSVNDNKFDTHSKVSKIIDLLRNDKGSASSVNRTHGIHSFQQPVHPASHIYSSLLQSHLLNEALNKSGLPKESAVLHNLTSIINKGFSSKDLNSSLFFNTIKKAHHIIPVPVSLSASNHSTNSASKQNDNRHASVSPKDKAIKNSTHITFHLIPESISNELNRPKNSLASKAGKDVHLLLQTSPNIPGNLTNSTKNLQQQIESNEKNREPSGLVPVEVIFHQNVSDYDGDNKEIVRVIKQVPPGNGTDGNRYVGALLSTQLFASRPQVIQNYYIKVPESYLRERNGIPLNVTARSNEGETLMEIRTHRTIINPKIIQKRSEKHDNISKEEFNVNLHSSAGNSTKNLNISQIIKAKVNDRQRASTLNGNPGHATNTRIGLSNAAKSQNTKTENIRPQQPTKRDDSSPVNKSKISKVDFPDWIKGLDGPVPGLRDADDETVPVGAPYKFTFLTVPKALKREATEVL
ncbi:uncharacterized protein [Palaemon carinicauda]|uniref:uncharacterized protein n=1 Tax=Palaemon carinicauda TaxID=392227 RepID=UPI0035B57BA5